MSTTIETLQAYPAGLKCQHLSGVTCEVIGFDFRGPASVMAESLQDGKWETSWVNPEDLTPYLNGFSALVTPLPDGKSLAFHLALACLPDVKWLGEAHGITLREAPQVTSRCIYVFLEVTNTLHGVRDGKWDILIGDDFEIQVEHRGVRQSGHALAAFQWLYKHHFALPINGRPLVEGVDFIPKS